MHQHSKMKAGIWGRILIAVAGLGVAGASGAAQAANWYGGIGVGMSKFQNQSSTCSSLKPILNPRTSCTFDLKDTGWKLFGGYQINEYAAVEVSYLDFGKMKANAKGTLVSTSTTATGSAEFKAKSFDVALVGTLPIGEDLGIIGRFGLFRWDVKAPASATATVGGTTTSVNPSKTGFDITLGAGVKYDFTKKVSMRAVWDRYKNVGDQPTTGESFSIDLCSVSLIYSF